MSFYKKISLIFIIAIALLLFVVGYFSSNFSSYAQRTFSGLRVASVDIDFFSGKANDVEYIIRGYPLLLGNISWTVDIPALVRLQLCMQVSTVSEKIQLSGSLCFNGIDNNLLIERAHFSVAASEISEITGIMIDGYFQGKVDKLMLGESGVEKVLSDTAWLNAQFFNGERWLALGDIQIETSSPDSQTVVAQWSDYQYSSSKDSSLRQKRGDPNIDVYVQTLFKNGRFVSAKGTINPLNDYDPALLDTLQLIAKPMPDGRFVIPK